MRGFKEFGGSATPDCGGLAFNPRRRGCLNGSRFKIPDVRLPEGFDASLDAEISRTPLTPLLTVSDRGAIHDDAKL